MTANRLTIFMLLMLPFHLFAITEYQLKSAYVYNIAKFIEWHPTKSQSSLSIKFCILGSDPFEDSFDAVLNKTINNKSINIENINENSYVDNCNIVFITKSKNVKLSKILKSTENKNILTISDIEGFVNRGGMIELLMKNGKIQIKTNLRNIREENILVSAKLLEVSKVVNDD